MITLVAFISVSKTRSESNSKMTIEVGTIVALCVLRSKDRKGLTILNGSDHVSELMEECLSGLVRSVTCELKRACTRSKSLHEEI